MDSSVEHLRALSVAAEVLGERLEEAGGLAELRGDVSAEAWSRIRDAAALIVVHASALAERALIEH